MLISHKYKFIYTKTIKTAGTSVEAYFERFCMPEGEWAPSHYRTAYISDIGIIGERGMCLDQPEWWNHMPADLIKKKLGQTIWNQYFKFCVVRNPYERAISAFFHFKSTQRDGIDNLEGNDPEKFEKWLELVGPPIDRQCYLIDNKLSVDFVIFYERLHSDLQKVCTIIGVPWNQDELPKYKSEFKLYPVVASDFYSQKAKHLVEVAYDFELKLFGYSFP